MEQGNEKKPMPISRMNLAAIITMFFMTMGYAAITPAMATIGQAFPDEEYTLISTLPNLFIVISSFIVGAVAGKRISFRMLAILGSLLTLIGGVAPAWIDSFWVIVGCRAVFGLGLGLTIPLANSLIIGIFDGDRQSALLGYGSMFMKAGGIILQLLGGVLADMGWHMTFYVYLLYIGSLVMALFIPEPIKKASAETSVKDRRKIKLATAIWVIAILMLVYNMQHYLVMMNVSSIFVDREIGGATMASTALSISSVMGCIGGLAFGRFFSRTKRFWLPFLYAITAIGAYLLATGESYAVMTVGICLCGTGFGLCIPTYMAWVGKISNNENFVKGTSVTNAFLYLGGFLATYWLMLISGVTGDGLYAPLWIECAIAIVLLVVFLVYNPFKEKGGEVQTA